MVHEEGLSGKTVMAGKAGQMEKNQTRVMLSQASAPVSGMEVQTYSLTLRDLSRSDTLEFVFSFRTPTR